MELLARSKVEVKVVFLVPGLLAMIVHHDFNIQAVYNIQVVLMIPY